MRYTKSQAIDASRTHYKASYINVAEMIGLTTNDRSKAKKHIEKFAEQEGLTVSEIFKEYNDLVDYSINEAIYDGYFDF